MLPYTNTLNTVWMHAERHAFFVKLNIGAVSTKVKHLACLLILSFNNLMARKFAFFKLMGN